MRKASVFKQFLGVVLATGIVLVPTSAFAWTGSLTVTSQGRTAASSSVSSFWSNQVHINPTTNMGIRDLWKEGHRAYGKFNVYQWQNVLNPVNPALSTYQWVYKTSRDSKDQPVADGGSRTVSIQNAPTGQKGQYATMVCLNIDVPWAFDPSQCTSIKSL